MERLNQTPSLTRGRPGPNDDTGARASLAMAILLQHQDQVRAAMQRVNYPPSMTERADTLIMKLNQYKRYGTAHPFQQEDVSTVINRWAKNEVKQSKNQAARRRDTRNLAISTSQLIHSTSTMLTAKYIGTKDAQGSAIAHGVYVPREGGKHRTTINASVSTELGWLARVSGHVSPHHHEDLANMWRALHTQGYEPNSRLLAMVKALSEIQAAIALKMNHCHGEGRPEAHLALLSAVVALQSTGHLVTQPFSSYNKDIARARSLGYSVGPLTRTQLLRDWNYHSRTLADVQRTGRPTTVDRTQCPPDMVGTLENPTRSSFFRNTPQNASTLQAPPSSVKDMDLHNINRGAHFAHCGGKAVVKKKHISLQTGELHAICAMDTRQHITVVIAANTLSPEVGTERPRIRFLRYALKNGLT